MKHDLEALKASLVHVGYLFRPEAAGELGDEDIAAIIVWLSEQGVTALRWSREATFGEPSMAVSTAEPRGMATTVRIPLFTEARFRVEAVFGVPAVPA